jgi:hypothetical protein
MAEHHFWLHAEVDSIKNWINDLKRVGYAEPSIVNFEIKDKIVSIKKNSNFFLVRYTPRFQKTIDFDNYNTGNIINVFDNYESIKFLEGFCMRSNQTLSFNFKHFQLESNPANVILIITFNFDPKPDNILVLTHIYKHFFKNIIFCAKDIINVLNQTKTGNFKFDAFTFIDLDLNSGYFHFDCMAKAYEMNFKIDGFLLMSDDVLLRYWKLKNFDLSKIWYVEKPICKFEVRKEMIGDHWHCSVCIWYFFIYSKKLLYFVSFFKEDDKCMKAVLNLWSHFGQIKNKTIFIEPDKMEMLKSFFINLERHYLAQTGYAHVCFIGSDFFYLPYSKLKAFNYLSGLFKSFNVVLELTVPTILGNFFLFRIIFLLKERNNI